MFAAFYGASTVGAPGRARSASPHGLSSVSSSNLNCYRSDSSSRLASEKGRHAARGQCWGRPDAARRATSESTVHSNFTRGGALSPANQSVYSYSDNDYGSTEASTTTNGSPSGCSSATSASWIDSGDHKRDVVNKHYFEKYRLERRRLKKSVRDVEFELELRDDRIRELEEAVEEIQRKADFRLGELACQMDQLHIESERRRRKCEAAVEALTLAESLSASLREQLVMEKEASAARVESLERCCELLRSECDQRCREKAEAEARAQNAGARAALAAAEQIARAALEHHQGASWGGIEVAFASGRSGPSRCSAVAEGQREAARATSDVRGCEDPRVHDAEAVEAGQRPPPRRYMLSRREALRGTTMPVGRGVRPRATAASAAQVVCPTGCTVM